MKPNFTILVDYFQSKNVTVELLGLESNPIVLNTATGEVLNVELKRKGVCFKFQAGDEKGYFIPWERLPEDRNFNFAYWISESSKRKIYLFEQDDRYFKRYNVKDNKYIAIFTTNLQEAYYAFRLERALKFQRTMHLKGVNLNIIRQWNKQPIKTS